MMTSLAFIAGLIPLVTATGASMISRRSVGTGVAGGMLFVAAIGIFVIPALYVIFQNLRETAHGFSFGAWRKRSGGDAGEEPHE
jgi:Cu/Ag efflux pump CusA